MAVVTHSSFADPLNQIYQTEYGDPMEIDWGEAKDAMHGPEQMYKDAYMQRAIEIQSQMDIAKAGGPMPEWYNTGENRWKGYMQQAELDRQLRVRTTDSTNIPFPQEGDVITPDSIMQLVRRALEDGVGKAVVTCKHCGQWAARFCECKKCGAPVD